MPSILFKNTIPVIALIFSVMIGVVSYWINLRIEASIRTEIANLLQTVLNTSHQAVQSWIKEHRSAAMVWANSQEVREATEQLLATPRTQQMLASSPAQARLRHWLTPVHVGKGYQGYFIITLDNISIASSRDQNIGKENLLSNQRKFLRTVLAGGTAVSLPQKSDVPLRDKDGVLRENLPTMFVGAPIKDASGKTIAIFAFRINPEEDFTVILQKGRIGETGETYAFDKYGRLISNSRYDEQLRRLNLIPPDAHGILNIELRDPGVDLLKKDISQVDRQQQPLTRMAASAIRGESAVNVEGYRDYRGVNVVGAWLWDTELGFGITTELDKSEGYKTLHTTQFVLLTLTILIILLITGVTIILVLYRQRKQVEEALRRAHDELEDRILKRTDALARANEALTSEVTERKQAEDALREERDFAEGLIETAHAIVLVLDTEARIVRFNDYMEQISGYCLEDVKGKDWFATFLPDRDQQRIYEIFKQAIADKKTNGIINSIVTRDGSERLIDWYDQTVRNASGEIIGLLSIGHDITERKQAEDKTLELLHQNRELTQRMFQIQEQERRHLARELHDEFGQWLTVIQLNTRNISNIIVEQSPGVDACIEAITTSARQIYKGIRRMIHNLRPALLDELGLEDSLHELVVQWRTHNPGTICTLSLDGELENLGENLNILVYRLVQEGLTNVAKHAQASRVDIRLLRNYSEAANVDCLNLVIEDDGKGIEPNYTGSGYGLLSMRERVLAAGGDFSVDISSGKGVRLDARLFVSSRAG